MKTLEAAYFITRKNVFDTLRFSSCSGLKKTLHLMAESREGNKYADLVYNEITDLCEPSSYFRDCGNSAPDLFRKVSIQATRQHDGYITLRIHSPLIRNLEGALATQANVSIGYKSCHIAQKWLRYEDRMEIPLSAIRHVFDAFDKTFDLGMFFDALARPYVAPGRHPLTETLTSPVIVHEDEVLTATTGLSPLNTVESYTCRNRPRRDYSFRIEGDRLTGPARLNKFTDAPNSPSLFVKIKPIGSPTFDKKKAGLIQNLGNKIFLLMSGIPPERIKRKTDNEYTNSLLRFECV